METNEKTFGELKKGDTIYFTTNKERAINNRKKILEAYIFNTEKNLNILKMELEEHMKEYEKIK